MKYLILFALVAIAASYTPSVYNGDKLCMTCGDPTMRTYDGKYLTFKEATKTLFSTNIDKNDPCKLDIHCITHDNYFGNAPTNPLSTVFIDWCGVSFWKHKSNPDKEFRNWMFGQDLDTIVERGTGIVDKPICRNLPHQFPFVNEDLSDKPWPGVIKPSEVCPGVDPVYLVQNAGGYVEMTSDCCPWQIQWYPADWGTCINIWNLNTRLYTDELYV